MELTLTDFTCALGYAVIIIISSGHFAVLQRCVADIPVIACYFCGHTRKIMPYHHIALCVSLCNVLF